MPEMRIGDAERDEAVNRLREHYAAGRITAAEFEERMGTAMAAHTRSELLPLFTDLPRDPNMRFFTSTPDEGTQANQLVPRQASPSPASPTNPGFRRALDVAVALAWPAAVIAMIAGAPWWVILIPIFLLPALRAGMFGSRSGHDARDRRHELRHDMRNNRRELRDKWRDDRDDRRGSGS